MYNKIYFSKKFGTYNRLVEQILMTNTGSEASFSSLGLGLIEIRCELNSDMEAECADIAAIAQEVLLPSRQRGFRSVLNDQVLIVWK